MRYAIVISFVVISLLLDCQSSLAQPLRTLSYQGVLTDTVGNPKPDGSYYFTFRLYGSATGGSALWTEAKSLEVRQGLFSTLLGDHVAFGASMRFDTQYWLTIQVGSEAELSPRMQLSTVGYSLNSRAADTAAYARAAPVPAYVDSTRVARTVPDASITSAKIQNGTIQFADIGQNGATSGQVIKWGSSGWAPAADASGGGSGGWADGGDVIELATPADTVAMGTSLRLGKLNVGGNILVGAGVGSTVYLRDEETRMSTSTPGYMGLFAPHLTLATGYDVSFTHIDDPGGWQVRFDSHNKKVGIGTLSPDDRLHVVNDLATSCWMRVETSHPTNWGQAGLRIKTPQNMWNLRMDTYANANLPAGALSLHSQDGAKETMTWLEEGNVGIGTTNPSQKLHVYGNAKVKDTLDAHVVTAGSIRTDRINAGSIENGPGVVHTGWESDLWSFWEGWKEVGRYEGWNVQDSATIQAPGPGYVLVLYTGVLCSAHTGGDDTSIGLGISTASDSSGMLKQSRWYINTDIEGSLYNTPFAIHTVSHVLSGGSYTYHLIGKRYSVETNDLTKLGHGSFSLLFVPVAYGVVESIPSLTQTSVSTGTSGMDNHQGKTPGGRKSLESEVEALRRELQALRDQVNSRPK